MICHDHKLKFYGEFRIEVLRSDGSVTDTGWMKNVITNIGLERLGGNDGTIISWFRLGTGTSVPSVTNTRLDNQIASIGVSTSSRSSSNYIYSTTYEARFGQNTVNGIITEMGVGWASTGDTLWSRSLITDSNGNPMSLTISSSDIITIYYRCHLNGPTNTITGTFTVGEVIYNYTARGSRMQSSEWTNNNIPNLGLNRINNPSWTTAGGNNSTLGTIDGSPSNTVSPGSRPSGSPDISAISAPYIAESKYLDSILSIPDWAFNISVGSPAVIGIKTIRLSGLGCSFQYEFDKVIPKTNTQSITLTFRYSWDRA